LRHPAARVVAAVALAVAVGAASASAAAASTPPASAASPLACSVTDGSIVWGFKESFRSYISGSIAHGKWTVSDGATYETPSFSWANGTGTFVGETNSGELGFVGAIDFTGHNGILNTVIANPSLKFIDASTASLLVDVTGTTQEGAKVDTPSVEFVSLDLGAVKPVIVGDSVTFGDIPASLTSDGARAFGTYAAGEAFDPVTIRFTAQAGCLPTPDKPLLRWSPWIAGVLVPLIVGGAVVLIIRRRRVARSV